MDQGRLLICFSLGFDTLWLRLWRWCSTHEAGVWLTSCEHQKSWDANFEARWLLGKAFLVSFWVGYLCSTVSVLGSTPAIKQNTWEIYSRAPIPCCSHPKLRRGASPPCVLVCGLSDELPGLDLSCQHKCSRQRRDWVLEPPTESSWAAQRNCRELGIVNCNWDLSSLSVLTSGKKQNTEQL